MAPAMASGNGPRRGADVIHPSVATPDAYAPVQPSTLKLGSEQARVQRLRSLVAPHVESFNFAMTRGVDMLPETIAPVTMRASNSEATRATAPRICVRYAKLAVTRPRFGSQSLQVVANDILPQECRRAGISYCGDLLAEYDISVGDETLDVPMRRIARIPVMVASEKCNLSGKSPAQMLEAGEEQYELGGFFIINGAEKLLRMIVVPRANCVISVRRDANMNRGPLYTDTSVSIRCLRKDLSTTTTHLHYLRTGGASLRVTVARAEYFLPVGVLLRALLPSGVPPRAIFDLIVGAKAEDEALRASALAIVTDLDEWSKKFTYATEEHEDVHISVSRFAALAFIGSMFRVVLRLDDDDSDVVAGKRLLRQYVLVHLSPGPYEADDPFLDTGKVNMLVHMIRKLVACASGEIELDNGDSPSFHELLLPGQLYLNFLKERLEVQLVSVAANIRREMLKSGSSLRSGQLTVMDCVQKALARVTDQNRITAQMAYFLATGNIKSESGLDLPQAAGYAIMAERINYLRFITHFRCVHRGAFYASMRTTKVRKLLPEAWGFICPVQTPDGAPCGLLNHLASNVQVTIGNGVDIRELADIALELGADPAPGLSPLVPFSPKDSVPLVCDGCVLGYVKESKAEGFASLLRQLKTRKRVSAVPGTSEVVHMKRTEHRGTGFYPGIYVYTTGCRMMRPVIWLQQPSTEISEQVAGGEFAGETHTQDEDSHARRGSPELIGTMEQIFLHVRPAVSDAEGTVTPVHSAGATHQEVSAPAFMSEVASLTPFPDMNQGPRNIFQCQMAKQTMGTPCHRFDSRYDAKLYRLTIPQVPITRNFCMQDPMGADLFPNGTNAIVAVISYTGYDMEDALILNQGSVNRGFAHGTIYSNKRIDLEANAVDKASQFGPLLPADSDKVGTVDMDGLPFVGARLRHEDKMYVTGPLGNTAEQNSRDPLSLRWTRHKSVETATVDQVELVNGAAYTRDSGKSDRGTVRQVNIRTRISRAPSVGDKFATRAGQKGTVASVWPTENMPFSESGMIPDVLFNPNGFPSRMTIGMMIENMAGKGGALHGTFHDSTPFRFDEKCRAVDYFGEQLVKAGYNYYGNETLYSGYTGEPFDVNIFVGVIHYQRLRHMVSDKFQVRSTGKIHPLYRQPIQGRKRGGAIRFGEMERDGVLAHGASFVLRDRLGMSSDMHVLHVCEDCGSLISPTSCPLPDSGISGTGGVEQPAIITCRICNDANSGESNVPPDPLRMSSRVRRVAIPYSFKYLVNELAAMNIRTRLDLRCSSEVGLRGPINV